MPDQPSMFPSTSAQAGQQAASRSREWRGRILVRLREQPSCLFEVADHFGVPDHTISGRFTELAKDGYIERTGERRRKPSSGCDADVWRVRGAAATAEPDWPELLGYPLSLSIDGEPYDRQQLLPNEGYPGFPYARRADSGGARLVVRVSLLDCPGCGRQLAFGQDSQGKLLKCVGCERIWRAKVVNAPGRAGVLALVCERP